nr:hypothetical protein CFP56_53634 [Quercus suber]
MTTPILVHFHLVLAAVLPFRTLDYLCRSQADHDLASICCECTIKMWAPGLSSRTAFNLTTRTIYVLLMRHTRPWFDASRIHTDQNGAGEWDAILRRITASAAGVCFARMHVKHVRLLQSSKGGKIFVICNVKKHGMHALKFQGILNYLCVTPSTGMGETSVISAALGFDATS